MAEREKLQTPQHTLEGEEVAETVEEKARSLIEEILEKRGTGLEELKV